MHGRYDHDRASLVRLLEDLIEPVGPEVFAGFGGPVAQERQWADDYFEGERRADAQKDRWVAEADPEVAVALLLAVGGMEPAAVSSLGGRRPEDWDYELVSLLHRFAVAAPDDLARWSGPHAGSERVGALLAEVADWIS